MAEDTTAPVIAALSFTPATVDVGDTVGFVNVDIRVTDDLSGVSKIRPSFVGPSGVVREGMLVTRTSGNHLDGVYRFHVTIPRYSKAGIWRLNNIYVDDQAGNQKSYSENELSTFGFNTQLTVSSNETVWNFIDDFNRSNGAVGNGWTAMGGTFFGGKTASIVSNRFVPSQQTLRCAFLRPESILNSVQELTHISTGAGGGEVLLARIQDNANCYIALYGGDTPNSGISRLVNGTPTQLIGGITRVPVSGDVVRFTVNGSLLKLEIIASGTVVASTQITDTTFTAAGKCGIGDAYGGATTDDYKLRAL